MAAETPEIVGEPEPEPDSSNGALADFAKRGTHTSTDDSPKPKAKRKPGNLIKKTIAKQALLTDGFEQRDLPSTRDINRAGKNVASSRTAAASAAKSGKEQVRATKNS